MDLKYKLCDYFHLLYRSLRFLDKEAQIGTNEELISMMEQSIDKLTAFINMLAVIDPTLPLLRCQAAIAAFHSDVHELFINYKENRLIQLETASHESAESIQSVMSVEGEVHLDHFRAQAHDLYLNTLHAAEKIIFRHVNKISPVSLSARIIDYFKGLADTVVEHMKDEDYIRVYGSVNELHFNLQLMHRMAKSQFLASYSKAADRIQTIRKKLSRLALYDDTTYRLRYHGFHEEQVEKDLEAKIEVIKADLRTLTKDIDTLSDDLINYLSKQIWAPDKISTMKSSLEAKNLGEAFH